MGTKYSITNTQKEKAKSLGVTIQVSTRKDKKLDVFNAITGEYITSIGDISHKDYYIYLRTKGQEYADSRRRLYKLRHESNIKTKTRDGKYTAGYLAWKLLW